MDRAFQRIRSLMLRDTFYSVPPNYMVPAAPGTLAFVKINSMGASMSEISQQYIILWIQCAIYFVLACRAYRYNIKKAKCERQ